MGTSCIVINITCYPNIQQPHARGIQLLDYNDGVQQSYDKHW